jgi:hypothetical protein
MRQYQLRTDALAAISNSSLNKKKTLKHNLKFKGVPNSVRVA